jgi:hypothetical protein
LTRVPPAITFIPRRARRGIPEGRRGRALPNFSVRCALILVIALILLTSAPGIARADTGSWSRPVEVSAGLSGWFPAIAADDSGNVHVVWQSGFPQQTTYNVSALYYARWNGQTWTRPTDIALIWADHALRSALTVDGAGSLHLLYKGLGRLDPSALGNNGTLGQEDIWYTTAPGASADLVHSWSPAQRVSHGDQGYYSDLAIDRHGVLHAIWTESGGGSWGIYYARSTDGGATWTGRTPLDDVDPVWWYRAHLKIDGQDRLHVVWEVRNPNETGGSFGVSVASRYAISSDGGQTWIKTTFQSQSGAYPAGLSFEPGPQQPSIGIDGQGTILFVYRDPTTNQIRFRQSSDGKRWSDRQPIPGVASGVERPYDIYDMAADSAGHVHLVMVGYVTGSTTMSLLHSEWDGKAWSAPSVVLGSPPYPEYPRLAVGQGNQLHLVWFDGDRPSVDRSQIGIYYSGATTTAPKVTARPVPPANVTPVTKPSDASVQSPGQVAPPPDAAAIDRASPWRADLSRSPMIAVGIGVAPVVILLLVLVVIRAGLIPYAASALARRR